MKKSKEAKWPPKGYGRKEQELRSERPQGGSLDPAGHPHASFLGKLNGGGGAGVFYRNYV